MWITRYLYFPLRISGYSHEITMPRSMKVEAKKKWEIDQKGLQHVMKLKEENLDTVIPISMSMLIPTFG